MLLQLQWLTSIKRSNFLKTQNQGLPRRSWDRTSIGWCELWLQLSGNEKIKGGETHSPGTLFINTRVLWIIFVVTIYNIQNRQSLPPKLDQGYIHVSVILFTGGGGIPACIAGFCPQGVVVSQHALQVSRPTPRHPGRMLEGGLAWGVSRPTPRGEVEGPGLGTWGAHTWGVGIPACTEKDYPSRRLLLLAVRILLECILLLNILS